MRTMAMLLAVVLPAISINAASADVFHMGGTRNPTTGQWTGLASLEFVTVGDPGNTPDTRVMFDDRTTGYGSVGYAYQMGKYDVTAAQYCSFLNAVAQADPYNLYDPVHMDPTHALPSGTFGIVRNGDPGSYTYTVMGNPNFPMNQVTWANAARFCNWLSNGQPVRPEGPDTTETGSYTLNGAMTTNALKPITRNPGAIYAIPTENEWYKAAYYKGSSTNAGYWLYPTQSNSGPSSDLSSTGTNNANLYNGSSTNFLTTVGYFAGSPGPYGTFDMAGDVFQWNEALITRDFVPCRGIRGGGLHHLQRQFGFVQAH